MNELIDTLRADQVFEAMLAQITQGRANRQLIAHKVSSSCR